MNKEYGIYTVVLCAVLAIGFLLGVNVGMRVTGKSAVPAHAAAVVQADKSVILERNPERARPQLPQIPKGAKVTRVTKIQIEPKIEPGIEPKNGAIAVQLTQIDTPEGSRVIASTDDGRVVGGADWVGPPAPRIVLPKWHLGAAYAWTGTDRKPGIMGGYARGPVMAVVSVFPGQIQAGVMIRW